MSMKVKDLWEGAVPPAASKPGPHPRRWAAGRGRGRQDICEEGKKKKKEEETASLFDLSRLLLSSLINAAHPRERDQAKPIWEFVFSPSAPSSAAAICLHFIVLPVGECGASLTN